MLTAGDVEPAEALHIGLVARRSRPRAAGIGDRSRRNDLLVQPVRRRDDQGGHARQPRRGERGGAIHLENRTQILAGAAGDINEAARAFMEKRPPVWNT